MMNITINNPQIEAYFSHSSQKLLEFIESVVQKKLSKEQQKYSKEAEEFLNLGGSNCWVGDLDEMRKDRLEYDSIR
ncbi:MAG: hypothetical protein JXQ76_02870 [Campylobacterales bacterium]|nr:hypothetical protein [Campylobacterales bacterium]